MSDVLKGMCGASRVWMGVYVYAPAPAPGLLLAPPLRVARGVFAAPSRGSAAARRRASLARMHSKPYCTRVVSWVAIRRRGRGQTQALMSRVCRESSGQWGAWQDWILPGCDSDITELQPRRCSRRALWHISRSVLSCPPRPACIWPVQRGAQQGLYIQVYIVRRCISARRHRPSRRAE
jgi:hypothetical protein